MSRQQIIRLLTPEEEISLLKAMSIVSYIRDGFADLICPVCLGRGQVESKNVQHTEKCWKNKAHHLLRTRKDDRPSTADMKDSLCALLERKSSIDKEIQDIQQTLATLKSSD